MIRLLTFTTLYPNAVRPGHGVFVENRLRHLLDSGEAQAEVIAPVPWFPFSGARFGEYGAFARVPETEIRHGIAVAHPRYPMIPKIGMNVAPWLMFRAMKPYLRKRIENGLEFDLIDAHYFYPDGVAAAMLGRYFGKPVVITARGSDINLIPRHAWPRRQILWAASQAGASITVCQALKDCLVDLGAREDRIRVLRNGVDLQTFQPPEDITALRRKLNIGGNTLISVGYLIPRKGHDLVIRSLSDLPDTRLLIAGDGPEAGDLRGLAESTGVGDRVKFLGAVAHDQLAEYYGAADIMILASSREGWANVLLEAMACGTPVVASNVWGTPEVVAAPEAGVLMRDRTPEAVADGVRRILADPPEKAAVRAYAERFSWDATTRGQIELFSSVLDSA